MKVESSIPLLEQILSPWHDKIGQDYLGYKNHVYRMLHCCFWLHEPSDEERQKLIIAAAFHDLGIWSAQTLDYLPPSIVLAENYLQEQGLSHWSEELELIIGMHHKLTPYRDRRFPLVEVFRQADLVDFSLGAIKSGVPKQFIQELKTVFPNAGFHKRLLQLAWQRLKQHPLNPAPMMKW